VQRWQCKGDNLLASPSFQDRQQAIPFLTESFTAADEKHAGNISFLNFFCFLFFVCLFFF
jgi:hypothetical protein